MVQPIVRRTVLTVVLLVFPFCPIRAQQEDRWDLGVRFTGVAAGGEPANDILGVGVFGHHRLNDRWLVGAALDQADYDFERPARVLGIQQDPSVDVIDAPASTTTFSVWAEREYSRTGKRLRWFWTGGIGFASNDVEDVTGPVAGGGTFDVTTDAGSEFLLSATGGLRLPFAEGWIFDFQVRIDHHLADWQVTDRVSGQSGSIDDYTAYGATLALSYRF